MKKTIKISGKIASLILLGLSPLCSSCQKSGLIAGKHAGTPVKVKVANVSTKGAAFTTDNLRASSGFNIQAYVGEYYDYSVQTPVYYNPWGGSGKHYFKQEARFEDGEWRMADQMWVADIPTSFWCWAPTEPNGTLDMSNHPASVNATDRNISYTMPHGTGSAGNFTDADKSDDLIFAFQEQTFTGKNEYVNLTFYHALSQISFCVSPNDGSYDKNLQIVSIALKNIPASGDCIVVGAPAGNQPEDHFEWSNLTGSNTVKQTYNTSFTGIPAGWTSGTYKKAAQLYNLYTSTNNFFIIPHQMDGHEETGTQIEVTFNDKGKEITVSKPLDDQLKPGYYYKYKLDATVIGRTIDLDVNLADWKEYDDIVFIEEN